jgi:hypothetical protein
LRTVRSNIILDVILNAMAIIIMAYRIKWDVFIEVTDAVNMSFAKSMLYTKFTPMKIQIPSISW